MNGNPHADAAVITTPMQCGARTRSGGMCKTAPMANGRCRMHGGMTPTGAVLPQFRHGRYSLSHRENMAIKAQQFLNDPAPGDLTGELALLRALLQTYLDRFEAAPLKLSDIQAIYAMIENIGRMVERISKILNETALTQAELQVLQARLADMMIRYIPNDDTRTQFMDELTALLGAA